MKVKLLRISKHITQKELAKMVGVSHVTIARIEKDMIDQIRVGTLKKVAKALDTTVKELFFDEEER
ncbi:helix-turn-helix transcriptional regulator [Clostridium massiliamazoniense]|uniref:helix-turn-helix transcriptional regulator n=1 Tax=Clostridium massiliamazoniense TaxID=1347366 RepID=UPI0006D7E771|nr:helix-turn-helix transcriptional regulator [Clostridium massiliamazoniense]